MIHTLNVDDFITHVSAKRSDLATYHLVADFLTLLYHLQTHLISFDFIVYKHKHYLLFYSVVFWLFYLFLPLFHFSLNEPQVVKEKGFLF